MARHLRISDSVQTLIISRDCKVNLSFSGKTTLMNNLTKRLGARVFHTPPEAMLEYRKMMEKQCQPVCRDFYSLGNYLVAKKY